MLVFNDLVVTDMVTNGTIIGDAPFKKFVSTVIRNSAKDGTIVR